MTATTRWDEHREVVVVGSGFAGLTAALEASRNGGSATVFEQADSLGGNSKMSDGGTAAVGTNLQERHGIEDSIDKFVADCLAAGDHMNDPELVRFLGKASRETVAWTRELGVEYDDFLQHHGGHSVPRVHRIAGALGGYELVRALLDAAKGAGVRIETGTALTAIHGTPQRIEGITVTPGGDDGDPGDGARRIGVETLVLAAGGFGNDERMVANHRPSFAAFGSTNHPFACGYVIRTAATLGVIPRHLSRIQLLPTTSPDETGGGTGIGDDFARHTIGSAIWIDPQTGNRFVNELADRRTRAEAIREQATDDRYPLLIVDTVADDVVDEFVLRRATAKGIVGEFNTLASLADEHSAPVSELRRQIERYNTFVRRGEDAEFDRPMERSTELSTSPWYAMRLWPSIHYTVGGLPIDVDARVPMPDGDPIPNLFAAGEITGGIHGATRLSGTSITECLCFGRVAGALAAGGRHPYA